jgi:signal transduction histidine kinase
VDSLERLRRQEGQRPYVHYQRELLLTDGQDESLVAQESPLLQAGGDARLLGWFQWEAGTRGAFAAPETFGPEASWTLAGLVEGYGEALRRRLEAAGEDPELRSGRQDLVPLAQVMANEERGQLLEELDVRRRLASEQQSLEPQQVEPASAATRYWSSFWRRAGTEPVAVRTTRFQYLVRAPGSARAPPLVAWRLVWIPAVYPERREIARDRWLLQGYALDPARGAPEGWAAAGAAQFAWAARLAAAADLEGLPTASLGAALAAEPAVAGAAVASERALLLVSRPDEEAAAAAWRDARMRFLLLVAALVSVVALGFVVLLRGVRKEVALARRKEDFVAAVTHELKTPLTGIRMHAEMLEQGWVDDPDAAANHARRIIEECGRLGHLVDQVLDLAALERGVTGPRLEPGDLGETVRASAALLAARAEKAGVALALDVPAGLPPAPHDPRLVRPLVLNLVENAIKYSERSAAKDVRVSLAQQGDRLVLTVADRGVGIAPEAQARLFQPFHRAGDEMTRAAPGVGIGLALVKRYADVHRARVTLESEPGRGTVVSVRFPLAA